MFHDWLRGLRNGDSKHSRRRSGRSRLFAVERLEDRLLLTLSPGNPLVIGTPESFSGTGTAGATSALNSFEAAIGGVNNGAIGPQAAGFRTINWDAVKLDGTD